MIIKKTTKEIIDDNLQVSYDETKRIIEIKMMNENEEWVSKKELIKVLDKYLLVNYPLLRKAKELILKEIGK
jgi:bacterioferritin (cytochrome b1)